MMMLISRFMNIIYIIIFLKKKWLPFPGRSPTCPASLASPATQLAEVGAGERTSVFAAEMRCTPRTLVASPYKVDIQWDGGRNGGF